MKVQYLEDFLLWFPDLHRLHTGTIIYDHISKNVKKNTDGARMKSVEVGEP